MVENSTDIKDLISNPNKFLFMIVGIVIVLLGLVVTIYVWFRKISRKYGIITKIREGKTLFNKVKKLIQAIKK